MQPQVRTAETVSAGLTRALPAVHSEAKHGSRSPRCPVLSPQSLFQRQQRKNNLSVVCPGQNLAVRRWVVQRWGVSWAGAPAPSFICSLVHPFAHSSVLCYKARPLCGDRLITGCFQVATWCFAEEGVTSTRVGSLKLAARGTWHKLSTHIGWC